MIQFRIPDSRLLDWGAARDFRNEGK